MPIKLEHIFSAPFLRSVLLRENLLKKYAPKIRSAAVNICCKFLYGNACVLYGNAYQAASPSLTSYGAESRPRSSPPPALKLAFLYGNAFLQQISTAARFLYAQATLSHESLHISAPLNAPQIRAAAVNICCKSLYGNACVLYGNAYQAARPALTSYGAESRPSSSPPPALYIGAVAMGAMLPPIPPSNWGYSPNPFLVSMGKSSL